MKKRARRLTLNKEDIKSLSANTAGQVFGGTGVGSCMTYHQECDTSQQCGGDSELCTGTQWPTCDTCTSEIYGTCPGQGGTFCC